MNTHDSVRGIDLTIEVPGTPEQVWQAIATGPGVSAWMHPTEIGEQVGGRYAFDMGSGMNDSGVVTDWQPPQRFATEGVEWQPAPEAAPARLATEWIVEARGGDTCVVRLVMSGFGDGAAWDDEIAGMTDGMRTALDNLRLYLVHHAGERGTWVRAFGHADGTREQAWAAVTAALGMPADPQIGRSMVPAEDSPLPGGVVERVLTGAFGRDLLVRVDGSVPAFAGLTLVGDDNWVHLTANLFGDAGAGAAPALQDRFDAWLADRFPART